MANSPKDIPLTVFLLILGLTLLHPALTTDSGDPFATSSTPTNTPTPTPTNTPTPTPTPTNTPTLGSETKAIHDDAAGSGTDAPATPGVTDGNSTDGNSGTDNSTNSSNATTNDTNNSTAVTNPAAGPTSAQTSATLAAVIGVGTVAAVGAVAATAVGVAYMVKKNKRAAPATRSSPPPPPADIRPIRYPSYISKAQPRDERQHGERESAASRYQRDSSASPGDEGVYLSSSNYPGSSTSASGSISSIISSHVPYSGLTQPVDYGYDHRPRHRPGQPFSQESTRPQRRQGSPKSSAGPDYYFLPPEFPRPTHISKGELKLLQEINHSVHNRNSYDNIPSLSDVSERTAPRKQPRKSLGKPVNSRGLRRETEDPPFSESASKMSIVSSVQSIAPPIGSRSRNKGRYDYESDQRRSRQAYKGRS